MYDQNKDQGHNAEAQGANFSQFNQMQQMQQPRMDSTGAFYAGQMATSAYGNQNLNNSNQFGQMQPNQMQMNAEIADALNDGQAYEGGNLRRPGEMIMNGELVNENGENVLDAMGHEETLATRSGATERKIKSELRDGDNISSETAKEVRAVIDENKKDPFELNEKIFQMGIEYRRELYGRNFGENNVA